MASLVVCGLYYLGWIYIIPRVRGYRIRQGIITLDNGAKTHNLIKVPVSELDSWDTTHDALGHRIDDAGSSDQSVQIGEETPEKL